MERRPARDQQMRPLALVAALALLVGTSAPARAAGPESLEERLDRIEQELGIAASDDPVASPQGPYRDTEGFSLGQGTSIGAYGEAIYNNVRGDAQKDQLDLRRLVLFIGHEFSDQWRFFSEIEFEHAKELDIEQAFIDWQPSEYFGLQTGLLLVPVGIVNLVHEPTTFYFAERPRVDNVLVPTTWREVGALAYGAFGDLSYQIGVLASGKPLDEVNAAGDLANLPTAGIRKFRQGGDETEANDLALVGRLSWQPVLGLTLATSGYTGEIDQDSGSAATDARLSIWEADVRWQWEQLEVRGQYAIVWIGDAGAINTDFGLSGTSSVPERMQGGYIEAAYNVLPHLLPESDQKLFVAFRGEWIDLQSAVAPGGAKTGAAEQQEYNLGLAWKPVEGIAIKGDYQIRDNDTAAGVPDRFNLAVGFSF